LTDERRPMCWMQSHLSAANRTITSVQAVPNAFQSATSVTARTTVTTGATRATDSAVSPRPNYWRTFVKSSKAMLLCAIQLTNRINQNQCYKRVIKKLSDSLVLNTRKQKDVVEQEGWLSPTEGASVSAISLRHIIWLPH